MRTQTFLGIKGSVVCLDTATGTERWRRHLRSSQLTTLSVTAEIVVAYANGHAFGLDRSTGGIIWENSLEEMGYGYCIIASGDPNSSAVAASHESSHQT